MRNWEQAFRRASFRGARFWVEEDGPSSGRRVAVMPVSGGEGVLTEDMGARAREIRVSAYVASDQADGEGRALEAACAAPGASLLTLPMDPAAMAHCTSCRRNRRKDRGGYIAYDLSFVPQGVSAVSAARGLAAVRDVFSAGLPGAVSGLAGAF